MKTSADLKQVMSVSGCGYTRDPKPDWKVELEDRII